MKKKVLIISYSYPPSNAPAAQRPYAVAKYLNKEEFEVTVITCGNADSSLGYNEGFDPELPSVKLIKVNSLIGSGASKLRESKMSSKRNFKSRLKSSLFNLLSSMVVPDKAIFWYPKVRRYLNNHADLIYKTDVLFTTSPAFSNHLSGLFVKNRNNDVLWITEMRDFHSIERTTLARNLKQLIDRRLERLVIERSDKVCFISHSMKEIYEKYYQSFNNKFSVIYNGFDLSDFQNLDIGKTANRKLTIFYAGSFYQGVRSPLPLLRILDSLIESGRITPDELEIRIAGNFESALKEEVKSFHSYRSISFIGNIPRAEVLRQLVDADLLWLIVGNKSTHYTGVPIKFFEYLGARRPILNFAPGLSEPSRIISENKLGWNFDTSEFNLGDSVEVFEQIIDSHKSGLLAESLQDKSFPEFDRQHQGKLFDKLFSGQ
ncbi:glycosyltransferase [Pedobacter frigoris]|uniref:glycosyltransferase n=1 Tax=Pedobacter frigoris TaxID=2571272 RepID=UPI00292CBA67|nr:glycosyltransferase [Pedobacter frigoris]